MSNKTIAKFYAFVISTAFLSTFFFSCSDISSNNGRIASESHYDPPKITGTIKSADITESSGIAASRCQNNVLWTHNDSGDGPFIFALNGSGESLGTWKVQNAENIDWEDIAAYKDKGGKCFLYIGDIGDNESKLTEHAVYRIKEPIFSSSDSKSDRQNPLTTEVVEVVRFKYPDHRQNAETLMVHPISGDIYVLTKRVNGPAGVYRVKPDFGSPETQKAQILTEISIPAIPNGLLTGGDISPDGRRIIICDYTQAYEYILPDSAANFDEIWKQKPEIVNIGERRQGEGVCYSVDGTSIFATSEGKKSPLIEVKRR